MRKKARVLQDLIAQLPEELDLRKGAELVVTGQAEEGWYYAEYQGKSGIVASSFVKFIEENVPTYGRSLSAPVAINQLESNNQFNGRSTSIWICIFVFLFFFLELMNELII